MPETYALRCCANIFNTANVRFLCFIVARVSWSSVDNSSTCVTGVNAGTIQCCGNSRKRGTLLFQVCSIGCSDSDPLMAREAMHLGREVPTMPLCRHLLHK